MRMAGWTDRTATGSATDAPNDVSSASAAVSSTLTFYLSFFSFLFSSWQEAQLIDMGFDPAAVRRALRRVGTVDRAVELLVSGDLGDDVRCSPTKKERKKKKE